MDAQMGSPDFWNNNERAQAHIAKLNALKRSVLPVVDFHKRLGDVDVMVELIEAAEGAEQETSAKDLDRQVAIKVLPETFSGDPEQPPYGLIENEDGRN